MEQTRESPTTIEASRIKFTQEFVPISTELERNKKIIDLHDDASRVIRRIEPEIRKNPNMLETAKELSVLNRHLAAIDRHQSSGQSEEILHTNLDKLAGKYKYASIDEERERQKILQTQMHNYIDKNQGQILRRINQTTTDLEIANPQDIENFFISTVADYVYFLSKAEDRREAIGGIYFGIGSNIGTQIRDIRFGNFLAETLTNENTKTIDDLNQNIIRDRAKIQVLKSDPNIRRLELAKWASDNRKAGERILETDYDRQIEDKMNEAKTLENGIGGIVLVGPPGPGKTERLIRHIRQEGFEPVVISLHRHTDFIQLIGEQPMPIGIDKNSGLLEKSTTFLKFLNEISTDQLGNLVQKLNIPIETFLEFAPELAQKLMGEDRKLEKKDFEELENELIAHTNQEIVIIGMGLTLNPNLNPEAAWVYGSVLQAFRDGRIPILDETDKASDWSLDGLSYALSMKRGESLHLASGVDFVMPAWAVVHATCNALTLPEYLHNRFAPNIIQVDYPPVFDMLQKAAVWLSDEQGNINLNTETETRIIAVFSYLIPQLEKLYYDKKISYPMSLRTLDKFCQYVRNGHTVEEAVDTFILRENALGKGESEMAEINSVVNNFHDLTKEGLLNSNTQISQPGLKKLENSPLYTAAIGGQEQTPDRFKLIPVELSTSDLAILEKSPTIPKSEKIVKLLNGLIFSVENNRLLLTDQTGIQLYVATVENADEDNQIQILDSTPLGNKLLISVGSDLILLSPFDKQNGKLIQQIIMNDFNPKDYHVFIGGDEKTIVCQQNNDLKNLSVIRDTQHLGIFTKGDQWLSIDQVSTTTDRNFLLITGADKQTYTVDLRKTPELTSGTIALQISNPLFEDSGWMIRGNLIINLNSKKAFLIN